MTREDFLLAIGIICAVFSILGIWLERRKRRDEWNKDFDRRYPPHDMDDDWFAH